MYPDFNEAIQCELLLWLGRLACAGANRLTESPATCRQTSTLYNCSMCDKQLPRRSQTSPITDTDSNGLISNLANLSKLPQLHRLGKPRVAAMLAIERALRHCEEQAHLDLTASVLGQCCLQALRSSSRDLRIAAGYDTSTYSARTSLTASRHTLPSFLRIDLDDVTLRRNRVSALDFLRNLSEKSELASQETCILAWGQIARYVDAFSAPGLARF